MSDRVKSGQAGKQIGSSLYLNLLRVIDAVPDMVLITDQSGNIIYANPANGEIVKYDPSALIGKSSFNIIHTEDAHIFSQSFALGLEARKPWRAAYRIIRKDGTVCHVESTVTILELPSSKEPHAVIITRDMSESVERELEIKTLTENLARSLEELKKQNVLAGASARAKSEFLANMSHELVTPLNAVIGYSQALIDGVAGDLQKKQREYLDRVLEGGEMLYELLRNMVELASVDLASTALSRSPIRVSELLNATVADVRDKALLKNINVCFHVNESSDITIVADTQKLMTALLHLAGNAVKFTEEGGSVVLSARTISRGNECREDWLEITISDTGKGIRKEDIPALFRQIGQIESPYTKKSDGVGVGLILVKRLIEIHGGSIHAESVFGKGSSFIISIPIDEATQERERKTALYKAIETSRGQ